MQDIVKDMKVGRNDWDPDERREIKGLRSVARDAAFRLLYFFILGELELGSDIRDSNVAYNAVLFTVSHPRIFKCRTRKILREAFEDGFEVSEKQRKGLNKWPISEQESDKDVTTEDELEYDSDWSM